MNVIRWAVKNPWISLGICVAGAALSAIGGFMDLRWLLESALFLALGAQIWLLAGKRGNAYLLVLTIWMTMTYIVMLLVGLGLQALIPNG